MSTPPGQILVVDDDEDARWQQSTLLEAQGWHVETASSRDEAMKLLATDRFDVVLLDKNLAGSGGPSGGIELLGQIPPGARAILVSGVTTDEAIRSAFARGAFDFVEKGRFFDTFIVIKVRQALELARAARLVVLDKAKREARLIAAWSEAQTETNAQKKGALLEEVVALLVASLPGFAQTKTNVRNDIEEFDVFVRNESEDPFWRQQGGYVLFECKNWSSRVPIDEFTHFKAKLEDRFGQTRLGFFIAMSGFTAAFEAKLLTLATQSIAVVPLVRADVQALIDATDRSTLLKSFVDRTVFKLS